MHALVRRAALSAALMGGVLGVSGIAGAAAPTPADMSASPPHYWVGPVVSDASGAVTTVNLPHASFGFTWRHHAYTVHFRPSTKWAKGTAKSLKAGLHVKVSGHVSGSSIGATRVVV